MGQPDRLFHSAVEQIFRDRSLQAEGLRAALERSLGGTKYTPNDAVASERSTLKHGLNRSLESMRGPGRVVESALAQQFLSDIHVLLRLDSPHAVGGGQKGEMAKLSTAAEGVYELKNILGVELSGVSYRVGAGHRLMDVSMALPEGKVFAASSSHARFKARIDGMNTASLRAAGVVFGLAVKTDAVGAVPFPNTMDGVAGFLEKKAGLWGLIDILADKADAINKGHAFGPDDLHYGYNYVAFAGMLNRANSGSLSGSPQTRDGEPLLIQNPGIPAAALIGRVSSAGGCPRVDYIGKYGVSPSFTAGAHELIEFHRVAKIVREELDVPKRSHEVPIGRRIRNALARRIETKKRRPIRLRPYPQVRCL